MKEMLLLASLSYLPSEHREPREFVQDHGASSSRTPQILESQGSCPLNPQYRLFPVCFIFMLQLYFKIFLYIHSCTHLQVYMYDKFLKMKFLSWGIFLVFIDTVKFPSKEIMTVCTPTASV